MSNDSLSNSDLRYKDVFDRYIEQGWQPIPLPYRAKKFPPSGVTGGSGVFSRDKIVNPSTGWLQSPHWAEGNTAIRAYGILGVDVDAYGSKYGDVQLIDIEAELGVDLPKTYYSTSRGPMTKHQQSGIRYYRVPTGYHFIGSAATDIELVYETYRYGTVWPSIHPTEGTQYRWYDADNNECGIPNVNDLPELPKAFVDAWVDRLPRTRSFVGVEEDFKSIDMEEFVASLSDGEPSQFVLDKMPEGWESGRFATLNQALWHIARLAVFNPEEPGLGTVFQRIVDARMNSSSATTPPQERLNHLQRSVQRAVAIWRAERESVPVECQEWARELSAQIAAEEAEAAEKAQEADTEATTKTKTKKVSKALSQSLADNKLAELIAENKAMELCFTTDLGWLRWTGKVWSATNEYVGMNEVRLYITNIYKSLAMQHADDADKMKEITVLQQYNKINAVFKLFKTQIIRESSFFDRELNLLNVQNGVVDLSTKQLMPHDPKYGFTKITKGAYLPGATHPDWDLAKEALDRDSWEWIQWKFGQGVTGYSSSDDIVPIFHGEGDNGKSVIITPIMEALGGFAVLVPNSVLVASKYTNQADITELFGARIGVLEELPEGHRLDVQRLKQITGTEKMSGRKLYKDQITWTPTHSIFITTNYQPIITETDHGTWKRVRKVNFPFRFVKDPEPITDPATQRRAVPNLRQRLLAGEDGQHEAVLAWLVDGAYNWYQNKRTIPAPPENIQKIWREWRGSSDHLYLYLMDNIEFDADGLVESSDLLEHFNKWMKRRGLATWGAEIFSSRMSTHEDVSKRDIKRVRTRAIKNLSRPAKSWGAMDEPMPPQVWAWKGIKFKKEIEETPAPTLPEYLTV